MDDFDFEEFEREATERELRWTKIEEDGVKDILRYFDRIHDNLSNYNNLLIGAFFALAQFQKNISRWTILIPIMNLWFLIYINYRLMEKSRFEASIRSQPFDLIDKQGKKITMTNWLSLLSIISTIVVSIAFLYYLTIY
ncbi:MAG: hypothetical protein ACLGH8_11445 [Bacteroidia bacterium]